MKTNPAPHEVLERDYCQHVQVAASEEQSKDHSERTIQEEEAQEVFGPVSFMKSKPDDNEKPKDLIPPEETTQHHFGEVSLVNRESTPEPNESLSHVTEECQVLDHEGMSIMEEDVSTMKVKSGHEPVLKKPSIPPVLDSRNNMQCVRSPSESLGMDEKSKPGVLRRTTESLKSDTSDLKSKSQKGSTESATIPCQSKSSSIRIVPLSTPSGQLPLSCVFLLLFLVLPTHGQASDHDSSNSLSDQANGYSSITFIAVSSFICGILLFGCCNRMCCFRQYNEEPAENGNRVLNRRNPTQKSTRVRKKDHCAGRSRVSEDTHRSHPHKSSKLVLHRSYPFGNNFGKDLSDNKESDCHPFPAISNLHLHNLDETFLSFLPDCDQSAETYDWLLMKNPLQSFCIERGEESSVESPISDERYDLPVPCYDRNHLPNHCDRFYMNQEPVPETGR